MSPVGKLLIAGMFALVFSRYTIFLAASSLLRSDHMVFFIFIPESHRSTGAFQSGSRHLEAVRFAIPGLRAVSALPQVEFEDLLVVCLR